MDPLLYYTSYPSSCYRSVDKSPDQQYQSNNGKMLLFYHNVNIYKVDPSIFIDGNHGVASIPVDGVYSVAVARSINRSIHPETKLIIEGYEPHVFNQYANTDLWLSEVGDRFDRCTLDLIKTRINHQPSFYLESYSDE